MKLFLDSLGHGFVLGLVEDDEEAFLGREEDVRDVEGQNQEEGHADNVRVHILFFIDVLEHGSLQIAAEGVDGEDAERDVDQRAESAADGDRLESSFVGLVRSERVVGWEEVDVVGVRENDDIEASD